MILRYYNRVNIYMQFSHHRRITVFNSLLSINNLAQLDNRIVSQMQFYIDCPWMELQHFLNLQSQSTPTFVPNTVLLASQGTSQTPLSLYLHIPFCGTRCTYCAFNTYTNAETLIPAYVAAMCYELASLGQRTPPQPLHTIFFGGGTPSLLTSEQVQTILDTCRAAFIVTSDVEITMEVNPGSIGRDFKVDYFIRLHEAGVNRLSIGMQSAHADELRLFARQHGVDTVAETIRAARQAGFDSVNLDLIYAAPYQTMEMWQASVEAALALHPDHLSMYALELEKKTPMTRRVEQGAMPRPDDDLAADMYEIADRMVQAAGLSQYEISNWSLPGKECRHNIQYWRNLPYLGVGAGAHGYAAGMRYEVVRPIGRYIELAMQAKNQPGLISGQTAELPFPFTPSVERYEPVDDLGQMAEHMITGLRLIQEGVSLQGFQDRFGIALQEVYAQQLDSLMRYDLLRLDGDRLRLSPQARLLSNQVFLQFLPE